mmetsp:Transcript_7474/g.23597  ORF Transcript_7474/g.23597 Transcript_7474/m.23597 type:complete len:217 (+) Transcript_7474:145-795(+)
MAARSCAPTPRRCSPGMTRNWQTRIRRTGTTNEKHVAPATSAPSRQTEKRCQRAPSGPISIAVHPSISQSMAFVRRITNATVSARVRSTRRTHEPSRNVPVAAPQSASASDSAARRAHSARSVVYPPGSGSATVRIASAAPAPRARQSVCIEPRSKRSSTRSAELRAASATAPSSTWSGANEGAAHSTSASASGERQKPSWMSSASATPRGGASAI